MKHVHHKACICVFPENRQVCNNARINMNVHSQKVDAEKKQRYNVTMLRHRAEIINSAHMNRAP